MSAATTTTSELPQDTRERLLKVAREVFSEMGFQGATVREICRRAEVNLAAVNYHFSSKEALFASSLDFKPLHDLCKKVSHEQCAKVRLQCFIEDFMAQMMDTECSPQCRLMMRELAEPTLALDRIVQDVIGPLHQYLGKLVNEAIGSEVTEEELRRCVFSILGQCLFYRHSYAVIQRLHPALSYDPHEIAATAQHIAQFSLAGLERFTNGKVQQGMLDLKINS